MSATYLNMNGWREILARIFDGFTDQDNISPEWLINPATRRRLKLDKFYPEAGIAVRFVGITAKGQPRQSDWDALESEQRDQTREELCRVNNVQLLLLNPLDDPIKQLDNLIRMMGRASRVLAQGQRPPGEKERWMPALSLAREQAGLLRTRVAQNPEQVMATLSENWRDREAGLLAQLQPTPHPTPRKRAKALKLEPGQRVRHERFGEGVVTGMQGENGDRQISILFDGASERTFLATLIADKITVMA